MPLQIKNSISAPVASSGGGAPPPSRGNLGKKQPQDQLVLPDNKKKKKRPALKKLAKGVRAARVVGPSAPLCVSGTQALVSTAGQTSCNGQNDDEVVWSQTKSKSGDVLDDDDDVVFLAEHSMAGSSRV
ncbi:hypothetical protein DL546_002355 [Coniochaeta pulveracea]|uniref:Uncharacterized protein n=1 Tax=Coniochaeta pulveracea TaxID=177199 RepID=A0A420Y7F3_9PEZI|nr:hypothetical protein DL546_002355 [Coniochaeta pulveracea]